MSLSILSVIILTTEEIPSDNVILQIKLIFAEFCDIIKSHLVLTFVHLPRLDVLLVVHLCEDLNLDDL